MAPQLVRSGGTSTSRGGTTADSVEGNGSGDLPPWSGAGMASGAAAGPGGGSGACSAKGVGSGVAMAGGWAGTLVGVSGAWVAASSGVADAPVAGVAGRVPSSACSVGSRSSVASSSAGPGPVSSPSSERPSTNTAAKSNGTRAKAIVQRIRRRRLIVRPLGGISGLRTLYVSRSRRSTSRRQRPATPVARERFSVRGRRFDAEHQCTTDVRPALTGLWGEDIRQGITQQVERKDQQNHGASRE